MSKLSREEIEIEYNRNWFKNRVLVELKSKLRKQPITYYQKNKERVKEQARLKKLYEPTKCILIRQ